MAPRTRNFEKKHIRNRKKEVRFTRRELPVRKSATIINPPANYDNLILHYLTKLKRLFSSTDHPKPKSRENSAEKMRREQNENQNVQNNRQVIDPNKYSARQSTPKPRENLDNEIKDKVYNVVNAAIEYGFANNVLEKKGDYFLFRNKRFNKIANRQPTPGPSGFNRSYCNQCKCNNCVNISKISNMHGNSQQIRPYTANSSSYKQCLERRPNSVHNSNVHETKMHARFSEERNGIKNKGRSSRSRSCTLTSGALKDRVRKVCTCTRCRALEQKRKLQRK